MGLAPRGSRKTGRGDSQVSAMDPPTHLLVSAALRTVTWGLWRQVQQWWTHRPDSRWLKTLWPKVRRWQNAVVAVLGALCVAGLLGYVWVQSQPPYWRHRQEFVEAHTNEQLREIGESVERRILAALTAVPEDSNPEASGGGNPNPVRQVRVLTLAVDDVNAWMHSRLKGWLRNQGITLPATIRQPMVAVDGQDLVAAFRYKSRQVDRVASVYFSFMIDPNGTARLVPVKLKMGRLRVPMYLARSFLSNGMDVGERGLASDLRDVLANGISFEPVIRVDVNNVRITDLWCEADRVNLTLKTEEHPPDTGPGEAVSSSEGEALEIPQSP